MENVIMNLRNMNFDDILTEVEIDDMNNKTMNMIYAEYPEIVPVFGQLNEHLMNYRKHLRESETVVTPRARFIARNKMSDDIIKFYAILGIVAKDFKDLNN